MTDTLYKFVNSEGKTTFANIAQVYPLPTLNKDGSYTPGEWIEPRDGILEEYLDSKDCGANRLHLMKSFNAIYAPSLWKCYVAEGEGLIGESDGKASYRRVRLLEPVDTAKLAREGNLRGANLGEADLQRANLRGADFRWVNLQGANLREADFRGADLRGVNLWGASLREADLQKANLRGADFRGANLRWADLRETDFRGADLREVNLWGADLREANLRGADLRGAHLTKEQKEYAVSRGAIV